jgi:hypothetical protein
LLNALSLALAAALIVVSTILGFQRLRSTGPPWLTTLPLTPAATLPTGQGWTPVGPPWAQQIVFAPSAPGTAYTCGAPSSTNGYLQAPMALGVSQDAGRTWRTTATQALGALCQLDVDPTDARDLLLQIERCAACMAAPPTQFYRSLDGGQSWRLITLPPLAASSSATYTAYQWAWQGSALFVSPSGAGTSSSTLLAISLAEGPFSWVNTNALRAGVPPSFQLNTVYAAGGAVFADLTGPAGCMGACEVVKRSADLGGSWSVFQPQYRGRAVSLLDQSVHIADGRTLVGQVFLGVDENTRLYVSSSDGGATWAPLPSPPGGLVIAALASTPSGALYAETWSLGADAAPPGVYRLTPGASGWRLIGALPNSGSQLAVSWDDQGAPLALWSGASAPQSAQTITAGIASHAP